MEALYPSQGHHPKSWVLSKLPWMSESKEKTSNGEEATPSLHTRFLSLSLTPTQLLQLNLDHINWISRIKKWQEDPLWGHSMSLN